jgi:hypothetical protein
MSNNYIFTSDTNSKYDRKTNNYEFKTLNVGFPNQDISIDFGTIDKNKIREMAMRFGPNTTKEMVRLEVAWTVDNALSEGQRVDDLTYARELFKLKQEGEE